MKQTLRSYTYSEYRELLNTGESLIDIKDSPRYFNRPYREVDVLTKKFKLYSQKCNEMLETFEGSKYIVLKSFFQELQRQRDLDRNYNIIYGGLRFDEKNYCELIGLTTYTKTFNYVYDLADSIDIVLSIMTSIPLNVIRKKIDRMCKKLNIDYLAFSRAWITGERYLEKHIPVDSLLEVDISLKNLAEDLLAPKKSQLLRLSSEDRSYYTELFLRQTLQSNIALTVDYILTGVITKYAECKSYETGSSYLISKGRSNVIVSSSVDLIDYYGESEVITYIDSVVHGVFKIVPKAFRKGEYLDILFERSAHDVVGL